MNNLPFDNYYNNLMLEEYSSIEEKTQKLSMILLCDNVHNAEKIIAEDHYLTNVYIWEILKCRFKLGEPIMFQKEDPQTIYSYIRNYVEEPIQEAEPKIAKSAAVSLRYAANIKKGKFELGEPAISKSALYSLRYAIDVLNGPFKLGEPAIAKDGFLSYEYAYHILKGPFKLGEPAIATAHNPSYTTYYAINVIKDRFELGEPNIIRGANIKGITGGIFHLSDYLSFLKYKNIPLPEIFKKEYSEYYK